MQYVTDMLTTVIIIVPITSSLKMMAITIINYPLKHRMRWPSFINGFSSVLNWSNVICNRCVNSCDYIHSYYQQLKK